MSAASLRLGRKDTASRLAPPLLRWYADNARRLPWRGKKPPYEVWVSEIMLQQTRVEAVVPYYRRWLKRFPTIRSLARATERDVLRNWEGLGYYARARNLRRAAKVVLQNHGGRLPSSREDLLALPGIGEYTAGAIASMAFGRCEPVLDGNVRRVLARVFQVGVRTDSAQGTAVLRRLAAAELPPRRAGDFNQALMDLGAMVCVPVRPRCGVCPLAAKCKANRLGLQERLPIRVPHKRIPHHVLGAVAVVDRNRVLLARRPSNGLLGGLWEFPSAGLHGPVGADGRLESTFKRQLGSIYGLKVRRYLPLGTFRHAYTHFRVTVHAYSCTMGSVHSRRGLRWIRLQDLDDYPMGKVDRQIAKMLQR